MTEGAETWLEGCRGVEGRSEIEIEDEIDSGEPLLPLRETHLHPRVADPPTGGLICGCQCRSGMRGRRPIVGKRAPAVDIGSRRGTIATGRRRTMTVKERVVRAVQEMPDDTSIEEVVERLVFLAKIERGIEQADAGQTVPHERVKDRMAKWLK